MSDREWQKIARIQGQPLDIHEDFGTANSVIFSAKPDLDQI